MQAALQVGTGREVQLGQELATLRCSHASLQAQHDRLQTSQQPAPSSKESVTTFAQSAASGQQAAQKPPDLPNSELPPTASAGQAKQEPCSVQPAAHTSHSTRMQDAQRAADKIDTPMRLQDDQGNHGASAGMLDAEEAAEMKEAGGLLHASQAAMPASPPRHPLQNVDSRPEATAAANGPCPPDDALITAASAAQIAEHQHAARAASIGTSLPEAKESSTASGPSLKGVEHHQHDAPVAGSRTSSPEQAPSSRLKQLRSRAAEDQQDALSPACPDSARSTVSDFAGFCHISPRLSSSTLTGFEWSR